MEPMDLPAKLVATVIERLRTVEFTASKRAAIQGTDLCLGASQGGGTAFVGTDGAASDAAAPLKEWTLRQP